MKLNRECMRAVLLYLENVQYLALTELGEIENIPVKIDDICNDLKQYDKPDTYYTVSNLEQAGYISASLLWADNSPYENGINYITYEGHEFIEKIRDDRRWQIINKGLNAVRDYSLSAISSIAEGATSAAISSFLSGSSLTGLD